MNFSSILFSVEHIAHPFTIHYNDEKETIADKKITLIALSILTGVLSFGVGGVIAFYVLSAKYKFELMERKESEFIYNYVEKYLHPYISGWKSERSINHEPVVDRLIKVLPYYEESKRERVEEIALDSFFSISAKGLYVCLGKYWDKRYLITPRAKGEFNGLVNALKEAIPKEFPRAELSPMSICLRAERALEDVNDLKIKEAKDRSNEGGDLPGDIAISIEKRKQKLEKLTQEGVLFF